MYTLWYSDIRGPRISIIPSRIVRIGHDSKTKYEFVSVPVTFTNDGGGIGKIVRVDLVAKNANRKKSKTFDAEYQFDATGGFNLHITGLFSPVALSAGNSFTEQIEFYPINRSEPFIFVDPGNYELDILAYTDDDEKLERNPSIQSSLYFFVPSLNDIQQQPNNDAIAKLNNLESMFASSAIAIRSSVSSNKASGSLTRPDLFIP